MSKLKKNYLKGFLIILIIICGFGFSSSVFGSNSFVGNLHFGCDTSGNLILTGICKTTADIGVMVYFERENLDDGCPTPYTLADSCFLWNSPEVLCNENQQITLTLLQDDFFYRRPNCSWVGIEGCPENTCETFTESNWIKFWLWSPEAEKDNQAYYFEGVLVSAIEIAYPEEDATITTDYLNSQINYTNFDNFYWLEWELEKWENATFTFVEEGIKEAETGNNTDTIAFYPLYTDIYYRFKVGLVDGDIADIWTGWRYFLTAETFEMYPPEEPAPWLPIDKEAFYIEHRGDATPTIAWTGITGIIDTVLNPVGNWSHFFAGFFSITGLHDLTASINTKINLIRSYFNYFDDFFGGFPIALIFGLFIIVLIGKTIISMVFKVINLIKP